MNKLFVAGLPYSLTNQQLEEIFTPIGPVLSATIITDKFSGQSKGFGFVEMQSEQDVQQAIKQLDGTTVGGRNIHVSIARPKEESSNRGNFRDRSFRREGSFSKGRNRR